MTSIYPLHRMRVASSVPSSLLITFRGFFFSWRRSTDCERRGVCCDGFGFGYGEMRSDENRRAATKWVTRMGLVAWAW